MSATTSTLSTAIDTRYEPGFVDELYRYSGLLNLTVNGQPVFPPSPTGGGLTVNWKVHTAGQTAEIYTEGQATPTPGHQTYVDAKLSPIWYRFMTEWTGHLEAALVGESMLLDAIALEVSLGMQDMMSLITQTCLGASNNGLQVAIDSTTTYAGISRASSPAYWSSYETAVGGALTLAALEDAVEAVSDASIGGKIGLWLAAPNQCTNYTRLPGVIGAANAAPRVIMSSTGPGGGGTQLDLGYSMTTLSYQGAPIVPMPGLTNTVWLGLDVTPGIWAYRIHQPFRSKYQGRNGDADQYHHSFSSVIQCRRPKRHAKLTGVTA